LASSVVQSAILALVFGGFLIFPATESLVRLSGRKKLSEDNTFWSLGMQVAFVLPFSMLLLVPQYRTNLFYPAMILLGAHYIPFVFLYHFEFNSTSSRVKGANLESSSFFRWMLQFLFVFLSSLGINFAPIALFVPSEAGVNFPS
jgi:hypothetical protein